MNSVTENIFLPLPLPPSVCSTLLSSLDNFSLLCSRELISSHPANLETVLRGVVNNELGQLRSPSNMALLSMMLHSWPEEAPKVGGRSGGREKDERERLRRLCIEMQFLCIYTYSTNTVVKWYHCLYFSLHFSFWGLYSKSFWFERKTICEP